jgi:hypothetical protein
MGTGMNMTGIMIGAWVFLTLTIFAAECAEAFVFGARKVTSVRIIVMFLVAAVLAAVIIYFGERSLAW